jgi:hypothetical protein
MSDGHEDDPIDPDPNALPREDLVYPEFDCSDAAGGVDADGGFDLERPIDAETAREWLTELAGGVASHDVAVEGPDGCVTLGVKPRDVALSFDADADHRGTFEVSFQFDAKAMVVGDPDDARVGARGGTGFVPVEQLTADDDEPFRCYSWVDDPTDP